MFACALPDPIDLSAASSGAVYACALPEPVAAPPTPSKGERWRSHSERTHDNAPWQQVMSTTLLVFPRFPSEVVAVLEGQKARAEEGGAD